MKILNRIMTENKQGNMKILYKDSNNDLYQIKLNGQAKKAQKSYYNIIKEYTDTVTIENSIYGWRQA